MFSRLSSLIERLRASLWLVPLTGLALAIGLAIATVWLDATTDMPLPPILPDDAETARSILGVVATSMLTFTALVFTITIVVLQLAASQYSPRITRAFLRDRQTKLTLALFLGTFAYSLLVLGSVKTLGADFFPTLSVATTYLLVLASLVAFTWYLDHVSQSIRVSNIVRRLAREGIETYERSLDSDPKSSVSDGDMIGLASALDLPNKKEIHWPGEAGIMSYVDEGRLVEIGAQADQVIALRFTAGDFVPHGAVIMEVSNPGGEEVAGDLCGCISIGPDRTPQQDLALPIRHLVDVALRALSPGINDPTTAIQAIDYIHDLLRRLAAARFPPHNLYDLDGRLRLVMPRLHWNAMLELALTEIRLSAAHQVQVVRRVMQVLEDLKTIAPPDRQAPIERQRELWLSASRAEYDRRSDWQTARRPDAQGLGVSERVV